MQTGAAPDEVHPYVLDPYAVQGTLQEFEIDRGYRALYRRALEASPFRQLPMPARLGVTGYDLVPCLAPGGVADVLALVLDGAGRNRIPAMGNADLLRLLELVINPQVDAAIKGVFKTEYTVLFAGVDTSRPGADADPATNVSYRWHCDSGPRAHLKVLVYLDEAGSHDGATAVIDRVTTDRFKEIGYVFGLPADRLSDLTHLAHTHALGEVVTARLSPAAGHGIFFEPANVLHRGVAPTFGQRRMLTVGFVPFPVGWRQCFTQFAPGIRENNGFQFPKLQLD